MTGCARKHSYAPASHIITFTQRIKLQAACFGAFVIKNTLGIVVQNKTVRVVIDQ